MLPNRLNRHKQGEISTGIAQISQKYSEISPLFRKYAPQQVKQSPLFTDRVSKYGTTSGSKDRSDVSQETPRKRLSLSKATFPFPALKYNRRSVDFDQVSLHSVPSVSNRFLDTRSKPDATSYSDARQDDIAIEENTYCSSVRTRQSPQTRLESLGSNHTWILLLLPAITAILVALLHPNCIDTVELSSGSCSSPFLCTIVPANQYDESKSSSPSEVLRILLEKSISSVNFIDVSMYIDHFKISSGVIDSGNRFLIDMSQNQTEVSYRIKIVLFSIDSEFLGDIKIGNDEKKNEIDNSILLGKLDVDSNIFIKKTMIQYNYIDGSNDKLSLLEIKSLNNIGYLQGKRSYPLIDICIEKVPDNFSQFYSSDQSTIKNDNLNAEEFVPTEFQTEENKKLMKEKDLNKMKKKIGMKKLNLKKNKRNENMKVLDSNEFRNFYDYNTKSSIELSDENDVNEDITVQNIRLSILTQSKIFSIWSSILILILSTLSMIMISISFCRIRIHVFYLLEKEKEKRNKSTKEEEKKNNDDENTYDKKDKKKTFPFFYCLELILPEQYSGFCLIIALICWLNPISAIIMILSVVNPNFSIPDTLLFFLKLIESLGRQGRQTKIELNYFVFYLITQFDMLKKSME